MDVGESGRTTHRAFCGVEYFVWRGQAIRCPSPRALRFQNGRKRPNTKCEHENYSRKVFFSPSRGLQRSSLTEIRRPYVVIVSGKGRLLFKVFPHEYELARDLHRRPKKRRLYARIQLLVVQENNLRLRIARSRVRGNHSHAAWRDDIQHKIRREAA